MSSPADTIVNALVEADGDLFLSANAGAYALVELRLVIDGVVARTLRTSVLNYLAGNMSNGWHLHTMKGLTAGQHEFHVDARVLAATGPVSVNSTQGRLTVMLLRQ
jgi:hypothetical protein